MPWRSSERTSNSKALSTISRFVFRRVSFFALRISVSLMFMLVRAINLLYANFTGIGVSVPRNVNESGSHTTLIRLRFALRKQVPRVHRAGQDTARHALFRLLVRLGSME